MLHIVTITLGIVAAITMCSFSIICTEATKVPSILEIGTIAGKILGLDFSKWQKMNGLKCIQKVICQAHKMRDGNKFTFLASSIRRLFSAPEYTTPVNILSPTQFAAKMGKYAGKECDHLFDCILDLLGSAQFVAHLIGRDVPLVADNNSTLDPLANDTLQSQSFRR